MWRLPNFVHAVAVEEDVVFLDVAADAYICLAGGAEALQLKPGTRAVRLSDAALADRLLEAGLLERCHEDMQSQLRLCVPSPRSSAVPFEAERPAWRDLPDAASAIAAVISGYVGRSLADMLRAAGNCGPDAALQPPSESLLGLAVRYNSWVPLAPLPTKCLLRAFMFRRLLAMKGHKAAWVFGVSTWPVQAHCWIQRGDVVLDDTIERVRAFHPIMAV